MSREFFSKEKQNNEKVISQFRGEEWKNLVQNNRNQKIMKNEPKSNIMNLEFLY
jgi:hypothetical protein